MQKYIKSLDGIRGFGIFFVLGYHFLRLNDFEWTVLGFSWIWIQMFFVQSGYLITNILLKSKEQPFLSFAGRFYWRRILRIFPVYFAYIFAFIFIFFVFHKPNDFLNRLPYLLTFSYNFTRFIPEIEFNSVWFIHFWSLAVEEQFYLIWPLVVYFAGRKNLKIILVAIIVLAPFFRMWLVNYLTGHYTPEMIGEITYAFTLSQFDAFAFGALIPVFNLQERVKNAGHWTIGTIVLVLLVGYTNYFFSNASGSHMHLTSLGLPVASILNFQPIWSYTLINIVFTFSIIYLIKDSYKGLFNIPFLVKIGKIVYGIYIYHFAILFLFTRINSRFIHSLPITFILGSAVTILCAYFSYQYFEVKFLAFKDHWAQKSIKPVKKSSLLPED